MYNFEHEVGYINNQTLDYFIGNDYFHDGAIHNIKFIGEDEEDKVEVVISCHKEWEADYNLENGYGFKSERFLGYDQQFNEKYLYKLTFLDCKLFESHVSDYGIVYLNGRFKQSAVLQQIATSERKNYFHLRIQLTGGYLDIIFADFNIEKVIGDVKMPKDDIDIIPFARAINKFEGVPLEEVRNICVNGDLWDRYFAIQYLCAINDSFVLNIAMKALNHEDDDDEVKLSAIYAIGKYANNDVIPLLFQIWLESDFDMYKKHIMDNIEKINYRTKSMKK